MITQDMGLVSAVAVGRRSAVQSLMWLDGLDDPDGQGPDFERWRRMAPERRVVLRQIVRDIAVNRALGILGLPS